MANIERRRSEANIYHITNRGVGRQIIFEDDTDRQRFMSLLHSRANNLGVVILAWCLMDNHVHILLKEKIEIISQLMLEVNSIYSRYFNKRHERVGSLFQGRFGSVPIETEKQLIATLRYIHRNPLEARVDSFETYAWSSYREYLEGRKLTSTESILRIVGNRENFISLHQGEQSETAPAERTQVRTRIREEDILATAQNVLGPVKPYDIKGLPKPQRNLMLCQLHDAGLSVRQIERLTGIGRSIINRASKM